MRPYYSAHSTVTVSTGSECVHLHKPYRTRIKKNVVQTSAHSAPVGRDYCRMFLYICVCYIFLSLYSPKYNFCLCFIDPPVVPALISTFISSYQPDMTKAHEAIYSYLFAHFLW